MDFSLQVPIYAQKTYLLTPLTSSWASTWSTPLGSGAPNLNKKDMGLLEQGQRRAWRCSQVCITSPLQTGWESWDWRRKGSKETLQHFQYLKGAYRKAGERCFMRTCRDGTRESGFKLTEGGFRLDIRQKCLTVRMELWRWWDIRTGCPEKLWMPHSWK